MVIQYSVAAQRRKDLAGMTYMICLRACSTSKCVGASIHLRTLPTRLLLLPDGKYANVSLNVRMIYGVKL